MCVMVGECVVVGECVAAGEGLVPYSAAAGFKWLFEDFRHSTAIIELHCTIAISHVVHDIYQV